MAQERRIVELGVRDVDLVEGLWKAMVTHHHEVGEGAWPRRDLDDSWAMRRAQYVGWLESGDAELFIVPGEDGGAPLGYACLRVESAGPTWDFGEVVGDIESLSVAAEARGQGVGSTLIEHCRERLIGLGARWWGVSVVAANARAAELYEREGFRPYVNHLRAPLQQ